MQFGSFIKNISANAFRVVLIGFLNDHSLNIYVFKWLLKLFSLDRPHEFDDRPM